jgi:positive regulator of sigma E activity
VLLVRRPTTTKVSTNDVVILSLSKGDYERSGMILYLAALLLCATIATLRSWLGNSMMLSIALSVVGQATNNNQGMKVGLISHAFR